MLPTLRVRQDCDATLAVEPQSLKALIRRTACRMHRQAHEPALQVAVCLVSACMWVCLVSVCNSVYVHAAFFAATL